MSETKDETFSIQIRTGNAAFEGENWSVEIARILREVAEKIENHAMTGGVYDINGNRVGAVTVS